ncbi:MAG: alpha/beta fold hydrolase [Desulfobacterales bacterium]|nr:alpha/beta fold hydrolase [Desulfobacterales bacterium]
MLKNLKNSVSEKLDIVGLKAILGMIHSVEWILNRESLNFTGQTAHDVIYQDDIISVYHYKPLEEKIIMIEDINIHVADKTHRIPVVFVPPLLAPGFAFDLYPERSLVRFFLAKGFDVYLVDFGSPTKNHSHLSFEDYILNFMPSSMNVIREHSGMKELSLYGYCMGGLFCLLYISIFQDENIKNLVTVASPIDMHQAGMAGKVLSVIARPAQRLARFLNVSIRDVNPKYLHIPGWLATIGFNLTNPLGFFKSNWDLILNLWDRNYMIAQESLGYWINNLLDYPGATVQEIVLQMGIQNKLARKGSMTIGDKEAVLKFINCSLLSFAGESDEIVPVHSAHKIMEVVSSTDKDFYLVPGGHVGLVIGKKAPGYLWKLSVEWLAERSN